MCQAPGAAQPGSGGSSAAGHRSCCWQVVFPAPLETDWHGAAAGPCPACAPGRCLRVSLNQWLCQKHTASAGLASGPSDTTVTPLEGSAFFGGMGVLPGLPTSGVGSEQALHLPETVVGIQGPFLSLASQHRALQSMWG